jgi:glycerol-3-phosphate dehydrogenase (NAD(P)+)
MFDHSPTVPPRQPATSLPYARIAVVGAGAWGTALAAVARRAGQTVRLWGRDAAHMRDIAATQSNARFLPGLTLPDGIEATADLARALAGAEAVLLVTPSTSLRAVAAAMRPHLPAGVPVALGAKGIEAGSGALLTAVVAEALPGHPVGVVSGPTFARETALGHPTAATVAFAFDHAARLTPEASVAARLAVSLSSASFRAYVSDDPVGVEIGGAVKNVIAIACGMMTGAGFAENTRAALIVRGLAEMTLLAEALGGRPETVAGLAGAGDLTLTCSSLTSRNMALGVQLGQGRARAACFDGRPVTVEGEVNAVSVTDLGRRLGLRLPVCTAVHDVLHAGADLRATFAALWVEPIEWERRAMQMALAHPGAPQ